MVHIRLSCLIVLIQCSVAPSTSVTNQGSECRWGRSDELFAYAEPHNVRGQFTVSVLIDHPPNVVYPLLPALQRELFKVLKRPVTVYKCQNTHEIYAKIGVNRYLITREKARLYHQSFYKTGIVLQTTSKRCGPDDIKCSHEEDLEIMKAAQEVFEVVLRRSSMPSVTPRPRTPPSPRDKWILLAAAIAVCIGACCVCCWDNRRPATDRPFGLEEFLGQNIDQPAPAQHVIRQEVTSQQVGNQQSSAARRNNPEAPNAGENTLNYIQSVMSPEEILLREQLYHERKDRALEVLSACNVTMLTAKKCHEASAGYIEKISQLEVDEESTTLKPLFEELKTKFESLLFLISHHNYPFLEKAHDFAMKAQNSPYLTAEEFAKYMMEGERCIKEVKTVLEEQLEKHDKEYDRLFKQLQNKGDTAFLERMANLNI